MDRVTLNSQSRHFRPNRTFSGIIFRATTSLNSAVKKIASLKDCGTTFFIRIPNPAFRDPPSTAIN